MATNQNNRDEKNKSNDEPDFSKDSTLEFHNKQNLKDLNSEAHSSKAEEKASKTKKSDDDVEEYKSHSVSKTSVRDRIPNTTTDNTPER